MRSVYLRHSSFAMAPKLYYNEVSAPARSVILTAKTIGVELELIPINLIAKEHLKPEFVQKNPQHTVPTLEDDGHVIWDSHAICAYLCDKYAKKDSLYPKDLLKRAVVNQRLFFNANILQSRMGEIAGPIIHKGATSIAKEAADNYAAAYDFLEKFLEGHEYIAGDCVTIADFCIGVALSGMIHFVPLTQSKHSKVAKWLSKLQQLPHYQEVNQVGTEKMVQFLLSKIK